MKLTVSSANSGTKTTMFGVHVPMPEGFADETVYLFATPGTDASARVTLAVSRSLADSIHHAIAQLGRDDLDDATVLADEIKAVPGSDRVHYERILRFADPASRQVMQQSVRVYHAHKHATVFVLSAKAIAFNAAYDAVADWMDAVSAQLATGGSP